MENPIKNPQTSEAERFRTWWAQLPLSDAKEFQATIKQLLGWTSQTWYERTHGKTAFKPAEKLIIIQEAGLDVFFVDQEADVNPEAVDLGGVGL
jgi:hypothetical protein